MQSLPALCDPQEIFPCQKTSSCRTYISVELEKESVVSNKFWSSNTKLVININILWSKYVKGNLRPRCPFWTSRHTPYYPLDIKKTSQELWMLSSVTLYCQVTMIVMFSCSQLSEMSTISQFLQPFRLCRLKPRISELKQRSRFLGRQRCSNLPMAEYNYTYS